jgi:hypothetical protein
LDQPLGTAAVAAAPVLSGESLLVGLCALLLPVLPPVLLPPVLPPVPVPVPVPDPEPLLLPEPADVLADADGLAVGDEVGGALVLALGLGLADWVGVVLAGAEGVVLADGWPAGVVAGATGAELGDVGEAATAVGVVRRVAEHVGDGVGRAVELTCAVDVAWASDPAVAVGVANGKADAIADDFGFTTPAPGVALAERASADAQPVAPAPPPVAAPEFPCAAVLAPSRDDKPPCRTPLPVRVLPPPLAEPSTAVVCPPVSTAELACTIAWRSGTTVSATAAMKPTPARTPTGLIQLPRAAASSARGGGKFGRCERSWEKRGHVQWPRQTQFLPRSTTAPAMARSQARGGRRLVRARIRSSPSEPGSTPLTAADNACRRAFSRSSSGAVMPSPACPQCHCVSCSKIFRSADIPRAV